MGGVLALHQCINDKVTLVRFERYTHSATLCCNHKW